MAATNADSEIARVKDVPFLAAAWLGTLLAPLPAIVFEALYRDRLESLETMGSLIVWTVSAAIYAIAAVWIFNRRWDYILRFPNGKWKRLLIGAAPALALLGWIGSEPVLLTGGWIAAVGYFLLHQHDRLDGRSFFSLWPLTWIAIRWPDKMEKAYSEWIVESTSEVSSYILDFLGVTHRLWQSELETEFRVLSIRSIIFLEAPWLWLLGLGVLYVSWKRQPFLCLPLSLVSGLFWTQSAYTAQLAWIGWNSALAAESRCSDSWVALVTVAIGLANLLLFLSTQQLWSNLFLPIDDGESLSRENPLVTFWNLRIAGGLHESKMDRRDRLVHARQESKKAPQESQRLFSLGIIRRIFDIPVGLERIGSFFVRWMGSRQWRHLGTALPAIVFGSLALVLWLVSNFTNHTYQRIEKLETLLTSSLERQDLAIANLAVRSLLDLRPDQMEYRFARASILDQRGFAKEARSELERLATEHRHGLSAMWIIGRDFELSTLKNWSEQSHRQFRKWMEIALGDLDGSNLHSAKVLMFSYLTEVGAYREATRFVADVIPSRPEMALAAASLFRRLQQPEEAERYMAIAQRHFRQKLDINVDDVDARINLARVLILKGEFAAAAELLSDGYRLSKDVRLAHLCGEALVLWSRNLGEESKTGGQLARRFDILKAAVNLAPNNMTVANALVEWMAESRQSKNPADRKQLDSILEGSTSFVTHFIRGTDALIDDRIEDAVVSLEKAMELQPQNASVWNNLAIAISKSNPALLDRALQLADNAHQKHPEILSFVETKGQILLMQEKWEEAIGELEKVVGSEPFRESASKGLAMAYRRIGSEDLAVLFEKAQSPSEPGE